MYFGSDFCERFCCQMAECNASERLWLSRSSCQLSVATGIPAAEEIHVCSLDNHGLSTKKVVEADDQEHMTGKQAQHGSMGTARDM
jgi:hypothetical protein